MLVGVLKKTWPLFLGVAFLMLGNGLQGTLVSWRASHEGFLSSTTAWIMTGYLIHIGAVHAVIILAVTYFMIRRKAVDEEDQTQYQVVPPRATSVALEAIAQEAGDSMGSESGN